MKFKRENDSGVCVYTILRNLDGKLFEKRATRSEAIPERVHFVKLPCTHIFHTLDKTIMKCYMILAQSQNKLNFL